MSFLGNSVSDIYIHTHTQRYVYVKEYTYNYVFKRFIIATISISTNASKTFQTNSFWKEKDFFLFSCMRECEIFKLLQKHACYTGIKVHLP